MNNLKKRGISPVIATVLLISIALTLAVIIFIWAKSFVSEAITKNGQAIVLVCDDLEDTFDIEYSNGQLNIINRGNVPLYGVEISKVSLGSRTLIGEGTFVQPVGAGESASIPLGETLSSGDKISVVPIILGEENEEVKRAFVCGENYAIESTVI